MNSVTEFVKALGPARLAAMGAVAAGLVGFFIFLMLRFSQPQLAVLYTDLTFDDSLQVVKKLEGMNIPHEIRQSDLEAVFDVPVNITAVLGRTHMEVADLLKLDEGDVVELDRKVGEAIDIFVNNRLVARGEVVLVEDRLGVTMTEIIKSNAY